MLERPQPRSGEDERAWRRQAAEDHRGRGRGLVAVGVVRGRVLVPGAWLAEWSHKHPSGAAPVCGRLPWPCVRDRAAQSC